MWFNVNKIYKFKMLISMPILINILNFYEHFYGLPKVLNKILSRFLNSICIFCFIGEDLQQITCVVKCVINLAFVH